jgi:membrane-bound serine protease (ClpP class)
LFVLGGIAIFLELANPGIAVPGVAGGALVLAALYGFVQADVRPLAVLLLVGALVLVGLEHIVMSHGGLTVAGIILLVGGALWLVDPAITPGFGVAPVAIGGMALTLGVAVAALVSLVLRVRTRAPVTGAGSLVGQVAEVRHPIDPEGMVYVEGALWSAWSDDAPIERGELVLVAGVENLKLHVRRIVEPKEA